MKLLVIGVNHKTTPVAVRERLAFGDDDVKSAQNQLQTLTNGNVIVSTCNRTEIYALVDNESNESQNPIGNNPKTATTRPTASSSTSNLAAALTSWLATFKHMSLQELEPCLYVYHDAQALTHWLRVAAGLDSMILGEPQIFGQIKKAVSQSKQNGSLSSPLQWIVDHVFSAAKTVRNDTDVGTQAITLGFAAAKLVTQIFDDPTQTTLLVVAAGEMNRLVATHIAELGVQHIIICNRSVERAQILAGQLKLPQRQIDIRSLNELDSLLPQADIVSSCSGSMNMLIDKQMTKKALKLRRYKPMLMVDLAVPRDIDSKVASLDDVYLYSVDDLQHVIAGNLEKRRQAAVEAELLVSHLVVEIERRFQVRKVGKDIHDFRTNANEHALNILEDSLAQLRQGNETPEAIMTELTRRLTQTLTHAPSTLMRKAAREGDSEMLNFVISGLSGAYRQK